MKVILVCGARPNFMKIAPLLRAINKRNASGGSTRIEPLLVHTGQHYDYEMSQVFFQDLELPKPDVYLGVGSGTHAEQTGKIMIELEKVLLKEKPDLVMVVGDVNSTLAGALAAVKLHVPVAHVEAGLRSYDRTMPEEINRLLTDQISDYLFTPSRDADENLKREGIPPEKIFFVGNIMVDSLLTCIDKAAQSDILARLGLPAKEYALLTLHRPENVDKEDSLTRISTALQEISRSIPILFPCHPRTAKNIKQFGLEQLFQLSSGDRKLNTDGVRLVAPLGYIDFLRLLRNCRFVMTDSGGIQEEATVLNVPCLTLRRTTERPITVTEGTNVVVGTEPGKIISAALEVLHGRIKQGSRPELWDGRTAQRIMAILARIA